MHQAIPYRSWQSIDTTTTTPKHSSSSRSWHVDVSASVSESAAIVFARRGCCMSHVVKRLLLGLGANPGVYEVDEDQESGLLDELESIAKLPATTPKLQLPAVFIGGTLFGGLERVMATHISGDLIPILKQAGALWL